MTFADYPQVFNGKRQYQIELHKNIPSSIRLGGRNCWVRYYGQPRTCLKCGGKGHDARECEVTVCFRCQKLGHIASESKDPVKCTVCQKLGHSFQECPISFANKINPAPLRWVSGSAVTVSNEECVEVVDNELDWSSVASQPVSQDPQPTVQNERPVTLVTVGETGDNDASTVCSYEGTDTHEVEFDSVTDVTEVTDNATDAQMDVDSGSQSQSLFKGVQRTVPKPPISRERTDHKTEDNASQADGQTSLVPGDSPKDELPRSLLGETSNEQSTSSLGTQSSTRSTDLLEDNVAQAKMSKASSSGDLENMEMLKTTQDSHDWATISRGRSSSQPTPSPTVPTLHTYDVGDIVQNRVSLETLDQAARIKYVENHFHPPASYENYCTQIIHKGNQGAKTLKFQSLWLDQYNWLVYSPSEAGGYCKYCVVFPPKNSRLTNAVLINRPFQNLQKAKGKEGVLDRHGQLTYHRGAVLEYKLFSESFRNPQNHVDTLLNCKRKETYEANLHILKSIVQTVILCGKQNQPLRGHRDDSTSLSTNKGNFLAILELISTRDEVLRTHLENGKKNSRYTSKTIQNQLISITGDYLRKKITQDLTEERISRYFSVIADEVTDNTTNKEVLSLCLRFLSGSDTPSSIGISEVFIDFVHLERTTGKAIADAIVKSLRENGFDIQNLRGQGYDGASSMSSSVQGVNGRIREIAPPPLPYIPIVRATFLI
ncbi:Zinc finger MYM-type protein 1 [Holothuria leucospilota]|uniref:Zinc finger MYM-type protein 1 n=1 Tax=Holothuria leucospilota TaxID=206669 RepID=A0A9Q1H4C4_HOLLE|nr:Zinc finger MYM-type protein 1 [Holothuria leucospilota]